MPDLLIKRREPTSFEVRDSVEPTITAGGAVIALDRFGFLLVDHIQAASDSAPVDTVILSSASSRTALAVAHELRQREHATVIGLASARNEKFVRRSGSYDEEVVEYGGISELSPARAVYVDFAGNADVRRQVHERLSRQLRRSIVVGASHSNRLGDDRIEHRGDDKSGGEAFALSPSQLPGPTPEFFFAGDPIASHVADSGLMDSGPWSLRLGSDS
jgi:hypothetical protein